MQNSFKILLAINLDKNLELFFCCS